LNKSFPLSGLPVCAESEANKSSKGKMANNPLRLICKKVPRYLMLSLYKAANIFCDKNNKVLIILTNIIVRCPI